jgi:heptosyltransferase-2
MTTPALMRLREARPRAHITLLTPAKLAELWQHYSAVDDVIAIERSDTLICVAKRIRRGRFDTAVLFPNSPRSALESSSPASRSGLESRDRGERGR